MAANVAPYRPPVLGWVLASLALVMVPHATRLPWWITVFALSIASLSVLVAARGGAPPSTMLRVLLVITAVTGVYAQFGTLLGRDAGVAMLVVMTALKLIELQAPRDLFVLVFLGYFLLVTHFLYSQSIITALYMGVAVVLLTAVLIAENDTNRRLSNRARLFMAGRIVTQALPLALVMFVLFPRVSGPLWGLPGDAHAGLTGFTDEVVLGRISRLSRSDAVAFRVVFRDPPPAAEQLYWRGVVLWHTDGQRWMRKPLSGDNRSYRGQGTPLRYRVTLDPHGQRWLFSLGLPQPPPAFAHLTPELELLTWRPVTRLLQYELTSYPEYQRPALTEAERQAGLQLPPGKHPRSVALARSWKQTLRDPEAIVYRALRLFRDQSFVYTLEPPPVAGDAVDGFLFDTHRGYCEHYATAFTVLMRAADIPARVVIGYQGATYNAIGGYFVVRQMDAHAWAEVWLDGYGWKRVDPTAAVAPERIERGAGALAFGPDRALLTSLGLRGQDLLDWVWSRARLRWDAMNAGWNMWVLAYGPQLQTDLFARLGWEDVSWHRLAVVLAVVLVIALAMFARYLLRSATSRDPVQRAYARFCRKLARRGLRRAPGEGPLSYAERAATALPHAAHHVHLITRLYVSMRYGKASNTTRRHRLTRLARRFHP